MTTIDKGYKVKTVLVESFCLLDNKKPNFKLDGPIKKVEMRSKDIFVKSKQ